MSSCLVLRFLGVGVGFVGDAERSEELAHEPAIGALVEESLAQPVEIRAGLVLDEGAPKLDQARGAARRLEPGQAFARQHGDRILERRFLARAGLGERASVVAVVEHGGDVRSHALHPARADGFDPRLLDRVEQGARRRALRREAPVDRVAVAGKAERERIGKPADDRGFARIGLARRLGQPGLRPFRRGHERRLVGRIGDLELGMTRQRTRARRERPLERLIGRIGLAGGRFAVAGRLDVDGRHERP